MVRPRQFIRTSVAGVAAAVAVVGFAPAAAATEPDHDVIASGLDNPRHLQFGADGTLYVAEAGRGGDLACADGPEGGTVCFGLTGAITAITGDEQVRVVTDLPSSADPATGGQAIGPSDVAETDGGLLLTVGLGADPAQRDALPPELADLGRLLLADPDVGSVGRLADIAGFEATANPDGALPDSNPNAVLAGDGVAVVVDAGGNSLLAVTDDGIEVLATFAPRPQPVTVPIPDGPPLGTEIPADAVPTSVAAAQDALVVGELTGFPFAPGGAQLYRVGDDVSVQARGFTNVVDVEVDGNGTVYVVELASGGLLSVPPGEAPTGRLVRVGNDGGPAETVAELPAPGGVAIRDGIAYVTINSTSAGAGEVVAIPLH